MTRVNQETDRDPAEDECETSPIRILAEHSAVTLDCRHHKSHELKTRARRQKWGEAELS